MPKKDKKKPVVIAKGSRVPNKNYEKSKKDFFFITSVSVFAALTIFAAEFMVQAKREERAAAKQQEQMMQLAPLDILPNGKAFPTPQGEFRRTNPSAKPSVKPSPKATVRPTPKPSCVPRPQCMTMEPPCLVSLPVNTTFCPTNTPKPSNLPKPNCYPKAECSATNPSTCKVTLPANTRYCNSYEPVYPKTSTQPGGGVVTN